MPSIKLICTDIDGTLLRPDHTISPRTKRAIQEAHKRGIIVALVSGRIGKSLVKIQEELGITGPLGTLNGSLVLDEKGRSILGTSAPKGRDSSDPRMGETDRSERVCLYEHQLVRLNR
ncbi:MAG: HAD-IIB family hydrolase, partial [Spirochaetota bacterium]|nr:HAD-IIB family hydrolase [Spirochaetota bacterium]